MTTKVIEFRLRVKLAEDDLEIDNLVNISEALAQVSTEEIFGTTTVDVTWIEVEGEEDKQYEELSDDLLH